ncbi:MAG: MBL fold metallo-hydrolase, partial [Deltaproteobacteria bacterium]|nr:MBL fold metallo-hydrolase [Deltaproteobacteria bacterium]
IHPPCARLYDERGRIFERANLVCHCLVLETAEGLALVDTGLGLRYLEKPEALGKGVFRFLKAPTDPEETAVGQLRRLGYAPEDVRHILLTHLDLDHAGGLPDFPKARVHVLEPEYEAAMNPSKKEKGRYVADMWAHGADWAVHSVAGEPWYGFPRAQEVLPGVLLVPLIGHTRGHCGVAVSVGSGWLLHCGDAYSDRSEVKPDGKRKTPLGARLYRRMIPIDYAKNLQRQAELRKLAREQGGAVTLFCAADPYEFRELSGAAALDRQEAATVGAFGPGTGGGLA